jgi:hypothetical protein
VLHYINILYIGFSADVAISLRASATVALPDGDLSVSRAFPARPFPAGRWRRMWMPAMLVSDLQQHKFTGAMMIARLPKPVTNDRICAGARLADWAIRNLPGLYSAITTHPLGMFKGPRRFQLEARWMR